MGVPRHAQITQVSFQRLWNILRKKLEMKLIFCIQENINVFHKLILAGMPKLPKITSLQYHTNYMLDYLDFSMCIYLLASGIIFTFQRLL